MERRFVNTWTPVALVSGLDEARAALQKRFPGRAITRSDIVRLSIMELDISTLAQRWAETQGGRQCSTG